MKIRSDSELDPTSRHAERAREVLGEDALEDPVRVELDVVVLEVVDAPRLVAPAELVVAAGEADGGHLGFSRLGKIGNIKF